MGLGRSPAWVVYSPLLPLCPLLFTGLYMFVLPYAIKWRSGRRASQTSDCPTLGVGEVVVGTLAHVIQILTPRQWQPATGHWIDIIRIHDLPSI